MSGPVLIAAREALAAGLSPIPVKADGTKAPPFTWGQFQRLRPSRATVEKWFVNAPDRGLAIICGEVSGGLELFDFDDADIFTAYLEAADALGLGDLVSRIRAGYEERTPDAGAHWFYRCAEVGGNEKLAQRPAPDDPRKPLVLLETRGEGGYGITAPTNGAVHPTGNPWQLLSGSFATIKTITPGDRKALFDLARSFDEMPPTEIDTRPAASLPAGDRPGDEFRAASGDLNGWRSILEPHGWQLHHGRGAVGYWRRPGKDHGWSATTGHAGTDLLYVFSESTVFDTKRGYNPYTAYTILEHDGDYSAAAMALAADGYGVPSATIRPLPAMAAADSSTLKPDPTTDPPTLSEHAMYGLAGDVVRAFDPLTEAHPSAVLASYLVAFGNAAGRSPHTNVGETRHGLNLAAVICGQTARSRKGTSWGPVERVFASADNRWLEKRSLGSIGSGEAIVWHIRDASEPNENRRGEMIVEDAGVDDKRLFIDEKEFSSLLKVAGRDGSTASEMFRKSWDSPRTLHNAVKRSPVTATGPHISLLGHITLEELRRTLTETEQANGLGNRILWVFARRSKCIANPVRLDDPAAKDLIKRTCKALELARQGGTINRDDQAAITWEAMYPELTREHPGIFGSMTARAEAQIVRLSMIYALLDLSSIVRHEHLLAATAFWQYCEDSVRYIFGDALGDPVADRILRAIRAHGELNETELHGLFSRNLKGDRLGQATARLFELGIIRLEERESGGKRARYWQDVRK